MGFNDINLQVSGPQQPASIYKTKVLKGQVPFAVQVTEPNTKYVIKHNFVLDGDVTIPANCILEFDGGSIDNSKIIFNNTGVEAVKACFGADLEIEGRVLEEASPEWFIGDDADKIEKAIKYFGFVQLSNRDYHITRTVEIKSSFCLKGRSQSNMNSGRDNKDGRIIIDSSVTDGFKVYGQHIRDNYYIGSNTIENVSVCCNSGRASNGFTFVSSGGPSSPLVIRNCTFNGLNKAINIDNTLYGLATGVSGIYIASCNIVGNNYGFYGTGNAAIGSVDIKDSNIEQNIIAGIYIHNSNNVTSTGLQGITIENNNLEGQPIAIHIDKANGCNILLRDNYYEYTNGQAININYRNSGKLVIDETPNTGNTTVTYNITNARLYSYIRKNAVVLNLTDCHVFGLESDNVAIANGCLFTTDAKEDNSLGCVCSATIAHNSFVNGRFLSKLSNSSYLRPAFTNNFTLVAGNYIFVCYLLLKNIPEISGNHIELNFGGLGITANLNFSNVYTKDGILQMNIPFTLSEDTILTNANRLGTVKTNGDTVIYISNCHIYPNTNKLISTVLSDETIAVNRPVLTENEKGANYFDRTLGKPLWYSGTNWVDATGTTV